MTPRIRKFALTVHIIVSVGWIGAVAAFLVLAVAGLTSHSDQLVRAAYLAAGLITTTLIVPLCLASLISGIVSSLGTEWGLFRHYWVLIKLVITVFSTTILLIHTQPISLLANAAAATTPFGAGLYDIQVQMLVASAAALLALIMLTVLSVYKPRGVISYGQRFGATTTSDIGANR